MGRTRASVRLILWAMRMKESVVEAALVERARALGGIAMKFTSPGRNGVPDRIVILPGGRLVFVELKGHGGRLSPGQVREHARLRELGQVVVVVDSVEQVEGFL